MGILDWASDKVQTLTGEKERRRRVEEFKENYEEFKEETEVLVRDLNEKIKVFNGKIGGLNLLRAGKIKRNIDDLTCFLGQFGDLKEVGIYSSEVGKEIENVPEKSFERNEDYIKEIDWSKEDVFASTFFLSPIGMRIKTNKQTLSMIEKIEELKIEAEHITNELQMKKFIAIQDSQICDIYIDCIKFIIKYIEDIILPELNLVEAFFQAQKINEELLCGHELENISFKNDIESIKGTVYYKHYLFVRNTFIFYIMACKIYDTPVLTKLLKTTTKTTKSDLILIEKQHKALKEQSLKLDELTFIKSRGK